MKAYALLVGVRQDNATEGCEKDVELMREILVGSGVSKSDITELTRKNASKNNILTHLHTIIQKADPGHLIVFYFSCHGSQVHDKGGDEIDNLDETLVCHDNNEICDDELRAAFKSCKENVRIVTICDSCHSGTSTQAKFPIVFTDKNRLFSKNQQRPLVKPAPKSSMDAMLIHMSASRDSQFAIGGDSTKGSNYTSTLHMVWNASRTYGEPLKNYLDLHDRVVNEFQKIGANQDPQYNEYGETGSKEFKAFSAQVPFTVEFDVSKLDCCVIL